MTKDRPRTVHETFMGRALELARRGEGRTAPNPPVGAVIVQQGRVVGEGFHAAAGLPHAEVNALHRAGARARGGDLYVTLEPCNHQGRTGPCSEALLEAGVARVFIGTADPNPRFGGGAERLRQAGLAVREGICESECRRLIAPFAKHVLTGLPHVVLKAAMTLDGQLATAGGESRWISSTASRLLVHRIRDRVDGILVGIGTVLRDDPSLTTRLPEGGRNPLRIVVDRRLRIPMGAELVTSAREVPTLIATGFGPPEEKVARLREAGVELLHVEEVSQGLELRQLMTRLGARGLQSLLLEGGSELNAAALRAGIVDRIMLFLAPKLLGGSGGTPLFRGEGVSRLADAFNLASMEVARVGEDLLVEAELRDVHRAG